jgi:hypothetical protein
MALSLYGDDYVGAVASGPGWWEFLAAVGDADPTELGTFCKEGCTEKPEDLRQAVLAFAQRPGLSADVLHVATNLADLLGKVDGFAILSDDLLIEGDEDEEDDAEKGFFLPTAKGIEGEVLKALDELLRKPVLCIDFDATLQVGDPTGQDPLAIGEPTKGAIEALRDLASDFDLVILTARDDFEPIWKFLQEHGATAYITDVTNQKPQEAVEFVDDRNTRFMGEWSPSFVQAVRTFQPYWKATRGTRVLAILKTDDPRNPAPTGTKRTKYSASKEGPFRCDHCIWFEDRKPDQGEAEPHLTLVHHGRCEHPEILEDPEMPWADALHKTKVVEAGACCEEFRGFPYLGTERAVGKAVIEPINPHAHLAPRIVPGYRTRDSQRAERDLMLTLQRVFRRQRDRAKEEAGRLLKLHGKVEKVYVDYHFAKWGIDKAARRIQATVGVRSKDEKGPQGGRTEVQSLIFTPKDAWTEAAVKEWLKAHDYKTELDETETSYRARQADPEDFDRIRTIPFTGDKAQMAQLLKDGPTPSDSNELADEIYLTLRELFEPVVEDAMEPLYTASLAGTAKGIKELEIGSRDLISSLNARARDWAQNRAAEMVGMRRQPDGSLVENPNPKWAISDTTRDDLRRIVSNGFAQETPLPQLVANIQDAGAFSDSRAEMIARTEVSFAQSTSNYNVWQDTGIVKSVTWQVGADHVEGCDCDLNDGEIVPLGEPFPSGDRVPPAHPNCNCAVLAVFGKVAKGGPWDEAKHPRVPAGTPGGGRFGTSAGVAEPAQAPSPPKFVGHRYGALGEKYQDEKGNTLVLSDSPYKGWCEHCGGTIQPEEEFYARHEPGHGEEEDAVGWQHRACAREYHLEKQVEAGVVSYAPLGNHHVAVTQLVTLPDGTRGVMKPQDGEGDMSRFRDHVLSNGYQTERERGAWLVAKAVGMDDLVAPVAEVTVNDFPKTTLDRRHAALGAGEIGGPGVPTRCAILEFEDGKAADAVRDPYDGLKDLGRCAAFDYVIGNTDRNGGNWLVHTDAHDKIRLIDHGGAFPDQGDYYNSERQAMLSRAMKEQGRGRGVGAPKYFATVYEKNLTKVVRAMREAGLPAGSIKGVKERIANLGKADRWADLPGVSDYQGHLWGKKR